MQDAGGDVSLDRYMRLPVEQYSELDPTIISPLEGKSFALRVPRIHVCPSPLPAPLFSSLLLHNYTHRS